MISEAAFFNLSNIVDIYPSVTIKPIPSITVMAVPDFLWRQASADGVYIGPSGSAFAAYSGGRAIGTDYNLEASWQTTDPLSFRLFETYFARGKAFAAAGAKKGNDFGVMSNCRI
nr:alginate export family protein [Novosphingobium profundi]